MSKREQFLAGERFDDVAFYLSESFVDDLAALEAQGERVEDGIVIVVEGDRGREAFEAATGMDAMNFAGAAMGTEGHVDDDLAGGVCPNAEPGSHEIQFTFAFAEAKNEDVGGLYAEGDVIHAYAYCTCRSAFSDKWVVGGES
jgi:hypothetical protein